MKRKTRLIPVRIETVNAALHDDSGFIYSLVPYENADEHEQCRSDIQLRSSSLTP